VSNIGAIGAGTYGGPLILPPQVCIVAIGNTKIVPRYNDQNFDKVVAKRIVSNLNNSGSIKFRVRSQSCRRWNRSQVRHEMEIVSWTSIDYNGFYDMTMMLYS
jgi:hypothetical protein